MSNQETIRTRERLAVAARYTRPIPTVSPDTTALLIIDMQTIFAGLWEKPEDLADRRRLEHLTAAAREAGCRIVRTQHGHANPETDGGELHRWWGSSIMEGSPAHRFIPGFEPAAGDIVIPKRRYDAFLQTNLETILRAGNIQTVIIGGVMTNLCCETTARAAFCRDFSVLFLVDGTATVTEDMQRGSLRNLGFGFAHLISCARAKMLLCR